MDGGGRASFLPMASGEHAVLCTRTSEQWTEELLEVGPEAAPAGPWG